jgi:voltage-dependent potassium channel beta subunit
MQYNNLGSAGIRLSELSYGSWITFKNQVDQDRANTIIKTCMDAGINFFDTAETYADGAAETLLGEALKPYRREDLVVSTKIFWGGPGPNDTGLSWKHLVEGTRNSLKRLQMEYVDLIFAHRPDPNTPIDETVHAMAHLLRQGYAFYWGTSEWSASQIEQAHIVARELRLPPPVMEQPEYNLFNRKRVEKEYAPLYKKYGLGTTTWSPLASGMLTGKYQGEIPSGSRLDQQEWLRKVITDERKAKISQLAEVAKELDCSLAQLSIAWCLSNKNVSTVILGASSVEQLQENLKASEVKSKLTPEVLKRIHKIVG